MYYKIKGGSSEDIQGYECQYPPVGYGKNRLTGELVYIGIVKSSAKKEEQYWTRMPLPDDWEKKCKREADKRIKDSDYSDPEIEAFGDQHWTYRLCGMWIRINGKDTYIPASYYMYLQWCPLDVGYPAYRNTDRQFFCVWEYCCEDPRCAGLVDVERRRMGKTYKSGSILLDRASIFKNHHSGIQSKTGPDAKAVFQKTVVSFFKKFPVFFRPVYDHSKGLTPTSTLRFFQTAKRGKRADDIIGAQELESWIDYGTSEPFFYDGSKLNTYVCDEFGKTMECNVYDRWQVVRFCLDQDGEWVGKALFTTTIEEMENGGENGRKIWEESDPKVRNENGRTKSGMYRFFLPAYETTFFDKYGMPETERAKDFYLKERAGLASNNRSLSSHIRKNPFTIQEAFRIDGDRCLFDPIKLNTQLDSISFRSTLTERGNFVWENGEPLTRVKWEKSATGRFQITTLMRRPEESNQVVKRNGKYYPDNNFSFTIGCDPFKYDSVKEERRSNCAFFVYQKANVMSMSDPYNETFVCQYYYRATTTAQQYDDVLKACWYYGCQVLFERNVDNWRHYFIERGCEGFLMKLPSEDDYGLYSDGHKFIHHQLADYTEAYINNNIDKVYFKDLIEDWLLFDIGKTTKYDLSMAAGYTLIAAREKIYRRQTIEARRDISDYFTMHKAI